MTRPLRTALRFLPLLALAGPAGGCAAAAVLGGVEGASVAVFGRDVVDIGVSAITGRDCSVVRLDRQQPYCAAPETLPAAPPFCTRTLGVVQCWSNPQDLSAVVHEVADVPAATPEQARQITARWPKSLWAD